MYRLEVTSPIGNVVFRLDTKEWDDMRIIWDGIRTAYGWMTDVVRDMDVIKKGPGEGLCWTDKVGTNGQFRHGWTGTRTIVHLKD